MAIFYKGETVICSILVKTPAEVLADPATSMKITITDNRNGIEIDNNDMVKTATGTYHYDWTTTSSNAAGNYFVYYKATDGSRITIQKDTFELKS